MRILAIDSVSPLYYDRRHLIRSGSGASEYLLMSLLLLIKKYREGTEIFFAQRHCQKRVESDGITYIPFSEVASIGTNIDIVLNQRHLRITPMLQERYPDSRIITWLHNCLYQDSLDEDTKRIFASIDSDIVVASEFAYHNLNASMEFLGLDKRRYIKRIYNFFLQNIKTLKNDQHFPKIKRNINRICMASEFFKSFDENYRIFQMLRSYYPELELHLARPGYISEAEMEVQEGVIYHGSLDRTSLYKLMKSSFCQLFFRKTAGEVAGMVIPEANFLGTPVLFYDNLDGQREMIENPIQLIGKRNDELILERFARMREHFPKVEVASHLRVDNVLMQWLNLLGLV